MKWTIKLITTIFALSSFSLLANPLVELYKSPTCGCCTEWAEIMQQKGYTVDIQPTQHWQQVKQQFGMPTKLMSCHTAVIEGYMIEGHVPESDIARLLSEKPTNIVGLAAPGMPQHSPGMAAPGQDYKGFAVIAFDREGNTSIYSQY